MRSWAVRSFLAVAAVGLVCLLVVAATDERDLAFTLGVAPGGVAADLPPGGRACQTPVAVPAAFDGVEVKLGTHRRPGPPFEVEVVASDGGQTVATGRAAAGYPDNTVVEVELAREVPAGSDVDVCVANRGRGDLAVYGGPELAKRGSGVRVGGNDVPTDMTLVFTRPGSSAASLLPTVFDRAALFRPGWVGAWVFWLLAGLVLLAVPGLLAGALRSGNKDTRG
ncbi:MAG: hypothetical protein GXY03_03925 [Solirubrobacterales bacterium]|nr:hypothetical protein [Solirubrobacterales bacterium]